MTFDKEQFWYDMYTHYLKISWDAESASKKATDALYYLRERQKEESERLDKEIAKMNNTFRDITT